MVTVSLTKDETICLLMLIESHLDKSIHADEFYVKRYKGIYNKVLKAGKRDMPSEFGSRAGIW
jgi:hypothetical protein